MRTKARKKTENAPLEFHASHVQTKRVRELAVIEGRMNAIVEKQEFLRRCGLDKEAARMNDDYNKLVYDRNEKIEQIERERRDCAKHLIMCFVAADLATECAEAFSKCLKGYGYEDIKTENKFTELLDGVAKEFNEIVVLIDGTGNYEMSAIYADMAEVVTTSFRKQLDEAITIFQNTKAGQRLF